MGFGKTEVRLFFFFFPLIHLCLVGKKMDKKKEKVKKHKTHLNPISSNQKWLRKQITFGNQNKKKHKNQTRKRKAII